MLLVMLYSFFLFRWAGIELGGFPTQVLGAVSEAVVMAVVALVSAIGLLYEAKWAKVVAVILSFWASMGSFPVLFIAVYTWWVIGSKQLNAKVVGGEGVELNVVEKTNGRNFPKGTNA